MYVMETKSALVNGHWHIDRTLHEMTESEFKKGADIKDKHPAGISWFDVSWSHVSGVEAHKHVRDGGIHTTGLWIDCDGKIRKS